MTRLSLSVTESDYKSVKLLALISGKSMSKLFSEWVKKAMKTKKLDDLGMRLLAMPIEGPEDELDEETMQEMERARKEPDSGKLEDLQKELGLDQHAS